MGLAIWGGAKNKEIKKERVVLVNDGCGREVSEVGKSI